MPRFLVASLLAVGLLLGQPAAADQQPIYTGTPAGLAVSGYDAVAYFTDGRPVEGSQAYSYDWQGAVWRFASQANLDRFKTAPATYAPQFGGYCAWAVSRGYTASADPQAWRIVDGKLYLNYDLEVKKTWEQDVPGNIAKGEANWPKVLDQ